MDKLEICKRKHCSAESILSLHSRLFVTTECHAESILSPHSHVVTTSVTTEEWGSEAGASQRDGLFIFGKKLYNFPMPLILQFYPLIRKNITLRVFLWSMASETMSNRSRNDLVAAPNDAFEVGRCRDKWSRLPKCPARC